MEKRARELVANKLRGIRAELGYNIEYVAEKSGVNKDTISRYENNVVSQQIDILEKILNVYNIGFDIFFRSIYANTQNKMSEQAKESE